MRRILFILPALLCFAFLGHAQNLTISSGGQTGISGINYSTLGASPITKGKLDILIIAVLDNQTTYGVSKIRINTNCL